MYSVMVLRPTCSATWANTVFTLNVSASVRLMSPKLWLLSFCSGTPETVRGDLPLIIEFRVLIPLSIPAPPVIVLRGLLESGRAPLSGDRVSDRLVEQLSGRIEAAPGVLGRRLRAGQHGLAVVGQDPPAFDLQLVEQRADVQRVVGQRGRL